MTLVWGFISGALKGMASFFGGLLRWIGDNPLLAALAGLALALLWLVIFTIPALNTDVAKAEADSAKWERRYSAEADAHNGTIANYIAEREIARLKDEANAKRVKREADVLSDNERQKYEIRIANLDARADRLRDNLRTAQSNNGGSGATDLPSISEATCHALGAASCEEHIAAMIDAQRSIDKLIGLQSFFNGIGEINVNGPSGEDK